MVFSNAGEDYIATRTGRERPKTRHDFTLPDLKWGVQRSLRCMKASIFKELVVDSEDEDKKEREREREREEMKPWNLRKRRAACKAPVTESGNCHDDVKFMSTLSKKEIEHDYMTMMGRRPPRRPKKRQRTLQKQIDLLHPAFYFTEVTEDIYQVPDAAENRKR